MDRRQQWIRFYEKALAGTADPRLLPGESIDDLGADATWKAKHAERIADAAMARLEARFPAPRPSSTAVPVMMDDAEKDPLQALLWFADEGHYGGTYRKGAGFADALGLSIARKALGLPVDNPDGTLMSLVDALAKDAE